MERYSASGAPARPDGMAQGGRDLTEDQLAGLIEAIGAERSQEAFRDLFRHCAPRIKAYAMKAGVDAGMAEEIAQESMIAIWRKAATFDRTRASAMSWIFTVARNKRIDLWRRESRPELEPDDPALAAPAPLSPDAEREAGERQRLIRRAVDGLPAEQAEVVQKAYFEDKSHSAISAELGLPLGTIKSRVRLALTRLRVAMEGLQA